MMVSHWIWKIKKTQRGFGLIPDCSGFMAGILNDLVSLRSLFQYTSMNKNAASRWTCFHSNSNVLVTFFFFFLKKQCAISSERPLLYKVDLLPSVLMKCRVARRLMTQSYSSVTWFILFYVSNSCNLSCYRLACVSWKALKEMEVWLTLIYGAGVQLTSQGSPGQTGSGNVSHLSDKWRLLLENKSHCDPLGSFYHDFIRFFFFYIKIH